MKWKRHETGWRNDGKSNFVKQRDAFANPRHMQFTIREMTAGWGRHALAVIALGLFLTFIGPFRSQEAMTTGPRLLFWGGLVTTGYLLALAGFRLIRGRPSSPMMQAITVALVSTLPQVFIVSWALVQIRPGRVITLANLPMLFLSALAIQAIIVAIQAWLSAHSAGARTDEPAGEEAGPLAQGRLARSLRGDLVALEAEDHYVRVHHPSGSTLILHRFSDALAEIDPRAGLQVHRGWWVASDAVAGTFMRGGKRWLKLTNGLEVPVSRTHLRRVNEQDWPRVAGPASART
jgi:DNA-binding LytR/AlgR family response regulator